MRILGASKSPKVALIMAIFLVSITSNACGRSSQTSSLSNHSTKISRAKRITQSESRDESQSKEKANKESESSHLDYLAESRLGDAYDEDIYGKDKTSNEQMYSIFEIIGGKKVLRAISANNGDVGVSVYVVGLTRVGQSTMKYKIDAKDRATGEQGIIYFTWLDESLSRYKVYSDDYNIDRVYTVKHDRSVMKNAQSKLQESRRDEQVSSDREANVDNDDGESIKMPGDTQEGKQSNPF
ncbi:hypothetical protein [Lactiplantibacillus songbeiensis]|uniref:Lipoprotein n=2 Tax=Lactiplantibacillus songbeiensis TaxID=2559920 RepID=A0ABW4C4T2_9LACO